MALPAAPANIKRIAKILFQSIPVSLSFARRIVHIRRWLRSLGRISGHYFGAAELADAPVDNETRCKQAQQENEVGQSIAAGVPDMRPSAHHGDEVDEEGGVDGTGEAGDDGDDCEELFQAGDFLDWVDEELFRLRGKMSTSGQGFTEFVPQLSSHSKTASPETNSPLSASASASSMAAR
jgi:hypothetical protein